MTEKIPTLTEATDEQLEAEIDARRVVAVTAATEAAKIETQAFIESTCPKLLAAGFAMGDEDTDEQYVTVKLPEVPPETWPLICKAMGADAAMVVFGVSGGFRVRKDRAQGVLIFIESYLPEREVK